MRIYHFHFLQSMENGLFHLSPIRVSFKARLYYNRDRQSVLQHLPFGFSVLFVHASRSVAREDLRNSNPLAICESERISKGGVFQLWFLLKNQVVTHRTR